MNLILFILCVTQCVYGNGFNFPSSEVFVLRLNHSFTLPSAGVTFKPNILEMPDLPSWLHYTPRPLSNIGYLYGSPPSGTKDISIEVVAIDNQSYDFSREVLNLTIIDKKAKSNEVQFKITNMNVDELIVGDRLARLNSIFVENMWPNSTDDGVVTSLNSATQRGDRLPLSPQDKEGVYISYGSSAPFSKALKNLEMEVKPLWNHRPCPKYFKKASYERYFQEKGFAIDWCSFKLHSTVQDEKKANMFKRTDDLSLIRNEPVKLVKRSEVPKRSYVWVFVTTVLTPLLVMVVLLGFLTLAMCCHRKSMDVQSSVFFDEIFQDWPRMPTAQDIHMVQYASVNKAVDVMKSMRGSKDKRDHSPHPSMTTTTTHVDTLPRSRTESPTSTFPRTSTPIRRFEDYATLNRPDPPPYQRNGSSLIPHD